MHFSRLLIGNLYSSKARTHLSNAPLQDVLYPQNKVLHRTLVLNKTCKLLHNYTHTHTHTKKNTLMTTDWTSTADNATDGSAERGGQKKQFKTF